MSNSLKADVGETLWETYDPVISVQTPELEEKFQSRDKKVTVVGFVARDSSLLSLL